MKPAGASYRTGAKAETTAPDGLEVTDSGAGDDAAA